MPEVLASFLGHGGNGVDFAAQNRPLETGLCMHLLLQNIWVLFFKILMLVGSNTVVSRFGGLYRRETVH